MKKIFLLSIILLPILSCKKEGDKSPYTLEGVWELRSEINGLNGHETEYPEDNGNLIIFSTTSYKIFNNTELVKSGNFYTQQETSLITKSKGNRIIFDNDINGIKTFVKVGKTELEMYVDAFDGPSLKYIKKRLE